jgi:hypothetical protein
MACDGLKRVDADATLQAALLGSIVTTKANPEDIDVLVVHVQHAEGEAKFWIEPAVELHANYGLKAKRLAEAEKLVEEHE